MLLFILFEYVRFLRAKYIFIFLSDLVAIDSKPKVFFIDVFNI